MGKPFLVLLQHIRVKYFREGFGTYGNVNHARLLCRRSAWCRSRPSEAINRVGVGPPAPPLLSIAVRWLCMTYFINPALLNVFSHIWLSATILLAKALADRIGAISTPAAANWVRVEGSRNAANADASSF